MTVERSADALLDASKPNAFIFRTWALCMLVALLDGFDLTLISFIAPPLSAELGLADAKLGIIFAASLAGMAVGGPIFGALGDTYGRKPMLVASCLLLGIPTLGIFFASNSTELILCRFVTGLGLSGAVPNVFALCAEVSPTRLRARILGLMGVSIPIGATIPGLLTATLVPIVGWKLLIVLGGAVPILMAILISVALSESPKFLMLRRATQDRAQAIFAKINPGFGPVDMTASPAQRKSWSQLSPTPLFRRADLLAAITPLLWAQFFIVVLTNFAINNWLPSILSKEGLSLSQAGFASALWSLGGVFGGIIVVAFLRPLGLRLLIAMFVLAIPASLLMSQAQNYVWLCLWITVGGVSIGCLQIALNTVCSMIYSTSDRVKGLGWALSVGRVGGICGPLVGGFALSRGVPPSDIVALVAWPLGIGLAASLILAVIWRRQRGGLQLERSTD